MRSRPDPGVPLIPPEVIKLVPPLVSEGFRPSSTHHTKPSCCLLQSEVKGRRASTVELTAAFLVWLGESLKTSSQTKTTGPPPTPTINAELEFPIKIKQELNNKKKFSKAKKIGFFRAFFGQS